MNGAKPASEPAGNDMYKPGTPGDNMPPPVAQ